MNKAGIFWGIIGFSIGMGYYQLYQVNFNQLNKKPVKQKVNKINKPVLNLELIRNYNYFSINLNNESRNIYIIESFNSEFMKDFDNNKVNGIHARINYIPVFNLDDGGLIQNIFCLNNNPGYTMFNYIKGHPLPVKEYCNISKIIIFNSQLITMNIESKLPIVFFDSGDVVYNLKNSESNLFNSVLELTKPKYTYTVPIYNENSISFYESSNEKRKISPDKQWKIKYLWNNVKREWHLFWHSWKGLDTKYYVLSNNKFNSHDLNYNINNYHVKLKYKTNNYEIAFWNKIHLADNNWFYTSQFNLIKTLDSNENVNYPVINSNDINNIKVPPLNINSQKGYKNNHQKPLTQEKTKNLTIRTYAPPHVIKVKIPKFAIEGLKH